MSSQSNPTRWGWIIFWLIVFWPVGLVLLVRRTSGDRGAIFKNTKSMTVTSYVLMGLAIVSLIGAFSSNSDGSSNLGGGLAVAILFGVGAAVLYRYAKGLKDRGERYKKYLSLVVNQRQTSIDNIAAAVGVPYDLAAHDLQKMIDQDYFTGAHIDVAQREVVLLEKTPVATPFVGESSVPEVRIVACPGCGANNKVPLGRGGECEYCGSPLV